MQECLLNLMPLCLAQTCYSTGSVSAHCGGRVARALQSWGSFMIARSLSYPGLGGVGAGANSCSCSWKAELRANDPRTKLTSVSLRVCTPKPGASDRSLVPPLRSFHLGRKTPSIRTLLAHQEQAARH